MERDFPSAGKLRKCLHPAEAGPSQMPSDGWQQLNYSTPTCCLTQCAGTGRKEASEMHLGAELTLESGHSNRDAANTSSVSTARLNTDPWEKIMKDFKTMTVKSWSAHRAFPSIGPCVMTLHQVARWPGGTGKLPGPRLSILLFIFFKGMGPVTVKKHQQPPFLSRALLSFNQIPICEK